MAPRLSMWRAVINPSRTIHTCRTTWKAMSRGLAAMTASKPHRLIKRHFRKGKCTARAGMDTANDRRGMLASRKRTSQGLQTDDRTAKPGFLRDTFTCIFQRQSQNKFRESLRRRHSTDSAPKVGGKVEEVLPKSVRVFSQEPLVNTKVTSRSHVPPTVPRAVNVEVATAVKTKFRKRLFGVRPRPSKKMVGGPPAGDRPSLMQVCSRSLKRAFQKNTPLPLATLQVALAVHKRRRLAVRA